MTARKAAKRPARTAKDRYARLRRDLAEVFKISPRAVTGKEMPEALRVLWRTFDVHDRMWVNMAFLSAFELKHKKERPPIEAGDWVLLTPEERRR